MDIVTFVCPIAARKSLLCDGVALGPHADKALRLSLKHWFWTSAVAIFGGRKKETYRKPLSMNKIVLLK
jgi:hypothetical protein